MNVLEPDSLSVRPMIRQDIDAVAGIHKRVFVRQTHSKEWIQCNYAAYPRMQFFVAEVQGKVHGYVHWTEKSGFRKEVVLELEQIAVDPDDQGKGMGRLLIERSIPQIEQQLIQRGAFIKRFLVSTRTDNQAQKLYRSTLNAKAEAVLCNLYSADEVFMVGMP